MRQLLAAWRLVRGAAHAPVDLQRLRWLGVWAPTACVGLLFAIALALHGTLAPWLLVLLVLGLSAAGAALFSGFIFAQIGDREAALAGRARQQAAVADLGRRALARPDLALLMDDAVAAVARTLDVEYGKVLELLPDGSRLRLRAGVGWKPGLVGHATVGAGADSQAGYTLLTRQAVVVDDLRAETRFSGPPLLHEHGVVSGLSVVIQGQGGPFGVLGAHTRRRRSFTEDDVHFLQAVANVLAMAIQHTGQQAALEELHTALANAMPGISQLDAEGRYVRVNDTYARLMGFEAAEMIGMAWGPTVHPDDREVALGAYRRMLQDGQAEFEARAVRRDGSLFHKQVLMVKRLDQDGTFLGHYCFMRDITERRRFEETLRALYQASLEIQEVASLGERLDRILRTAQTVLALDRINILLADEGSQELRAAAALGVDEPLEAIRVPIGPAGGGIAQSYLSQQPIVWADSQTPVPEALRLKPPYDRIRAFRSRAFVLLPLVVQGRSIGVMGADRKVSRRQLDTALLPVLQLFAAQAALAIDRARLHEQLLQAARQLEATVEARTRELQAANERLQEASRHKSAFLATMSHEFRTPLNSILGYSELLQNPVYGPLTEKQARYLGYIHSSGRHLLALIDDLLDLSKIEAGKLELRPAAFHLPEALEAAVNMLRPQAEAKGIEVRLDLDRTLSAFVADPVRFRQILYNLLSNAVKFTPAGGNVTLSARRGQRGERDGSIVADGGSRCAPALADADEFVEIAVRDTGIGIKPDDLAKLFRVFTQLDARPGTRQGVGLGLALTKQLVELHGGTILAASDGEGKGSTFTLRLPFPSPTGRDLPCAASAAVAGEVGKAIRRATGAR